MLMIIYLIAVMILTPIIYDYVNRKITADNRVLTRLKGLPSYVINLIICAVEAVVALVMPGGYGLSIWNFLIFAALIYLGNQIVFNFAVKAYSKARSAVQHGGAVQ